MLTVSRFTGGLFVRAIEIGHALAAGDEQIELLLRVAHGPEHGVFLVLASFLIFVLQAHLEGLDALGLVAMNLVDGPGHLEVPAGIENRAARHGLAEAFEQRLLAGFNDDE